MANERPSPRIIEIAARRLDDMTLDPEIRSVLAFVLNAAPDRHPQPSSAAALRAMYPTMYPPTAPEQPKNLMDASEQMLLRRPPEVEAALGLIARRGR